MLHDWVAGKFSKSKILKVTQTMVFLSCTVALQEEFGTLKTWYDHIGGDAIGLTWTQHNSKVRNKTSDNFFQTNKKKDKSKQTCSVWLQKRERDEEEVETNPVEMLKAVGEMGKGLVRDIYLLKAPRFV